MIKYNKLLKKMGYKDLEKVVGASTTKTIKKNGYIRKKTMEKICKYFRCQPNCCIIFYKIVHYPKCQKLDIFGN